MQELFYNFYTTERRSIQMTDQGGACGFDIHYALELDYLIRAYNCDAIIETGTNGGDTTEYLAKQYPHLKIITCEIIPEIQQFAKNRLSKFSNVECLLESSDKLVERTKHDFVMPLYYLDAHGMGLSYFPLQEEINSIVRGVVSVGDVKTHDKRYNYDTYNNVPITKAMARNNLTPIYYNNSTMPNAYDYPCMQMVRRTGRMYYCVGYNKNHFKKSNYFVDSNEVD